MRRKAGIAVAACAAVMLAGVAGVTAWQYAGSDDGRPVGTWHDPPGVARTPVAAEQPGVRDSGPAFFSPSPSPSHAPSATGRASASPAEPLPATSAVPKDQTERFESATTTRQQVGQLLSEQRMLDYQGAGPKRETFRYPGASYVKLHFGRLALLPGDYLTVSNADGTESYRYGASGAPDADLVDKWAMSVTGDTAVLEVHRGTASAPTAEAGTLGVGVDRVARGFSRTEQGRQPEKQIFAPGRTGREESVCGSDTSTDAVCYRTTDPVAYTKSKAIARLLINGTELCTGWRVGTQNRMLTNNHCFATTAAADGTEVWFNYQCATCGGYDVVKPAKVWGAKVLSTDHLYDYTLFSVDNFAAVQKFGYLTLDAVRPAKDQGLYVPQHPAGEPTRIAGSLGDQASNCAVVNAGYDGYAPRSDVAYYCDTEGGSSGSPVLSRRTHKVVALHHFGGCPNSGVRADLLAVKLRGLV
ncbi:MAG TPA: serine protease [Actinoplanes sp.]|jgi:V8-like Glu-specific endopeptidase